MLHPEPSLQKSSSSPVQEVGRSWDEAAPRLIVVLGVCGCGKSTLGASLAKHLKKPFLDGDDFHPAENKEKMLQGTPLNDADRWPWLDALARSLAAQGREAGLAVAACSALRRVYRERLVAVAAEPILFVMLNGSSELIAQRLASRTGHFMPATMLQSQLAILEPPQADEQAITLDISQSVPFMVRQVHDHLFARR